MRPTRRERQRGQSMIELCLILPICLTLFMGVYTAGAFVSDLDVAGQAVRAGARLGAEVGDCGYSSGAWKCGGTLTTSPAGVDGDIVTSVVTVAKGLQNASSLDEIDVYDPCASSGACSTASGYCSDAADIGGSYQSSVDPTDVYKLQSGTWTLQGTAGYTLNKRSQAHPYETAIGVRLVYHFHAAAPMTFFNIQTSAYATMCFAPYESGG